MGSGAALDELKNMKKGVVCQVDLFLQDPLNLNSMAFSNSFFHKLLIRFLYLMHYVRNPTFTAISKALS
jgi:hypothetical protein